MHIFSLLLNDTPDKPANQNGTFKDKYNYNTVKLDENSVTDGPKPQTTSSSSGEKTTLTNFISRPPYFRYLEEWGETFCRERKKRLKQIKEDCKVENGGKKQNPKCSCYGENCDDQLKDNPTNVSDLKCPGCGKHCRYYKKWIQRKKEEFTEQANAYKEQQKNCEKGSNKHDKGFCVTRGTCSTAKEFLQKLRSCSKTNNGGSDITFDDSSDTFKPAKDCKPCSKFKINCENGNCSAGGTKEECNGNNKNSIAPKDIKNSTDDLDMLVSDDSTNGFNGDDLKACIEAGIFQGIRKDVWTCGKVCGYNVCKPKNVNGQNGDGNQIIIIRALFKIWLEYFLEDYNKIKKKLNPCRNNGEVSKCINGYDKAYKCVEQWIKLKKDDFVFNTIYYDIQ
ncbi:hypothetical protein PFFCH_05584 [Plasmodium falciparum FCH/4]|uniref:Duffy-binding-like domain-containing protein n=1 Tax=Plasmodium falciparum FCH/4 TaxID=1036724 RepID=A0A024VFC2_PLAFA|nr:hypothetical protein PFFCH_05584 [Plasmodium falciparum FCH/4]